MQTLVIVLFVLSLLAFVLKLSLFQSHLIKWIWLVAVGCFIYQMHHWAIEQSYTSFRTTLRNSTLMMDFVVLQVLEALGGIILSIYLIRSYYKEPVKKFLQYAVYWPGLILFPALFYLESFIFLNMQGIAFPVIALSLSLVVVGVMYGLIKGLKVLVPEFDLQLELKFIIHLLQLFAGIILSVIMLRLPVNSAGETEVLYQPLIALVVIGSSGIMLGLLLNRWKVRRMRIALLHNKNQ